MIRLIINTIIAFVGLYWLCRGAYILHQNDVAGLGVFIFGAFSFGYGLWRLYDPAIKMR